MSCKKLFILVLATCVCVSTFSSNVFGAALKGVLSNFDLKNTTGQAVDDLHIVVKGVSCADVWSYYNGSGYINSCADVSAGVIEVTVSGFSLADGAWGHYGVSFKPGVTPQIQMMYWTVGGVPTGALVDFTDLKWVGYANCPVDASISRSDSASSDSVTVSEAEWAVSATVIPLDNMLQSDPLITGLSWMSAASLNGTLALPSEENTFTTPPVDPNVNQSVLVRYHVVNSSGDTVGVFLEQVEVTNPIPTLSGLGLVLLAVLLMTATAIVIRRRRRHTT